MTKMHGRRMRDWKMRDRKQTKQGAQTRDVDMFLHYVCYYIIKQYGSAFSRVIFLKKLQEVSGSAFYCTTAVICKFVFSGYACVNKKNADTEFHY